MITVMRGSFKVILFLSTILIYFHSSTSQSSTYTYHFCETNSNYTDITFRENLGRTLISLYNYFDGSQKRGFYNASTGQSPNRASSLALCRADVSLSLCRSCVRTAGDLISKLCSNQKEGIIWYDECMLRYSNRSIFSVMEETPLFWTRNRNSPIDPYRFNTSLANFMNGLVAKATSSRELFFGDSVKATASDTIYSLVQCTPDINSSECNKCLARSVSYIFRCCDDKIGGRVLKPSCNIWYDIYPFYNQSALANPSNSSGKATLIISITTVSIFLCIVLLGLYYMWRRKARTEREYSHEIQLLQLDIGKIKGDHSNESILVESPVNSKDFPFWRLKIVDTATDRFSDHNKLGEGGFGPVYKGTLANGTEIAVKKLARTSGQGLIEFKNEVTLIAQLQHINLVRLLGCCLEGNEKLLIYEFMPNKSLDVFLFDSNKGVVLNWEKRLHIINGIARGLLYLHEDSPQRIIHRDLKASNILLDHELNPKISDFGMARIFGRKQMEACTSRLVGTYGYMAPEYAMEGLFSIKSDVFSFGVLLLEIISGKRNNGFYLSEPGQSLLTYAWKLWMEEQGLKLVDPSVGNSYNVDEVLRCIHIGLLCVQEKATDRPITSSIILMLTSHNITLPQPKQPAFSVGRQEEMLAQTASGINACSVNEVSSSNVLPR